MRNKLLHALANRPGPFNEAIFGAQPEFHAAVFDDATEELRNLLFLNDTTTDFYLKRYLSLIAAHPDLEQALEDTVVTYRVWDFLPVGVKMDGGELLSADQTSGRYVEPAIQVLPINLNYSIDFSSPNMAKITAQQQGLVRLVPALATGPADRPWLRIEWPEGIPFEGPLRLTQPWVAGARINIEVEPGRFPYAAMVQRIQSSAALNQHLANAQLLNEFHGNQDAMEQLAVAITVVALANPSVYGK